MCKLRLYVKFMSDSLEFHIDKIHKNKNSFLILSTLEQNSSFVKVGLTIFQNLKPAEGISS